MKKILPILLSIILTLPFVSTYGQMEGVVVDTIEVGSTALWIDVSGDKIYVSNPQDGTIAVINAVNHEIIQTINAGKVWRKRNTPTLLVGI